MSFGIIGPTGSGKTSLIHLIEFDKGYKTLVGETGSVKSTIVNLENGYESEVGERGSNLTTGQNSYYHLLVQ